MSNSPSSTAATPTKRLTASEKEILMRINVAMEILSKEKDKLSERAALIPGAKRDLAMMRSVAKKMLDRFARTIPEDQAAMYERALAMVSYQVGVKKPAGSNLNEKEYGMWLPYEIINIFIEAMHDHCMMCSDDKAQRRACKLRKALYAIPNDCPPRNDDDCPYYTIM